MLKLFTAVCMALQALPPLWKCLILPSLVENPGYPLMRVEQPIVRTDSSVRRWDVWIVGQDPKRVRRLLQLVQREDILPVDTKEGLEPRQRIESSK